MIKTNDFPNIEKKVNKLVPILTKYNFEDLASAIYCVGVCINNRSSLESTLALNWALQLHKHTGMARIESYAEFKSFFESVKEILKPSPADDAVIEDYGDVYVEVFGNKYSVILGTGHNMVFACLQFLPYLARATKHEEELVNVMKYNSHVIEYLKDVNVSDGDYGARFVIPSEDLFNRVSTLFQNKNNQVLCNVAKIVDSELIEKMHFITIEDSIFPLANTSLLLDLYDKWYQELDGDRRRQFINSALSGIALSLSKFERDENVIFLCPVASTETVEKPVIENVFPFVLMSSKGMILAINQDDYDGNIEGIIEKLTVARNKSELHMIETISRNDDGSCRGITVTSQSDIQFLVYDNWANPEETPIMLKEGVQDYFTCTALDIVYYLLFMDDSDELYDYLKTSRESKDTQIWGFGGDVATFFMWKDAGHMFEKGAVHYSLLDVGYDTENEYVVDYYREKLNSFPIGRGDYILENPFAWNVIPRENEFFEYVQKGKAGYGGLFRSFRNGCYFFFPHNVVFYPDIKE